MTTTLAKKILAKEIPIEAERINREKHWNTSSVESIIEPALYYGFFPIKPPTITPDDTRNARHISEGELVIDGGEHTNGLWVTLPEKVALLQAYERQAMYDLPQPVMVIYERAQMAGRSPKHAYYSLDIIGSGKSVSEAILIQTAYVMLSSLGYKNLRVEVNSIGDKDTLGRFTKEFSAYYKKNIEELHASCRQEMKKDLFSVLSCAHEKCKELAEACPKSMNFLSERSREHFKGVIEHLEASHMTYAIKAGIVSNRNYCTETIFEIKEEESGTTLAVGFRYDGLAKRLGARKDLPAVGISVMLPKPPRKTKLSQKSVLHLLSPNISYIHLGLEAKQKSLETIEMLRKAHIPIAHSLAKDKIAGQVSTAEKNNAKAVIIMGKKEAVEDSVIVRDNTIRAQDTVPLSELAGYLKKMKL